jgi:hypothetical protein
MADTFQADDIDAELAVKEFLTSRTQPPAEPKTTMRNSFNDAIETNPDEYAGRLDIAERTGQTPETVERQPELLGKKAKLDSIDFDTFHANSPMAADFLANTENAKLAHDDMDNMGSIEQIVDQLRNVKGPKPTPFSFLRGVGGQAVQGTIGYPTRAAEAMAADIAGDEKLAEAILLRDQKARLKQALIDPDFNDETMQAVYSGVASTLQAAPGIAAGLGLTALTKNPVAGTAAGLSVAAGQVEAEAYLRYRARGAMPMEAFLGATAEAGTEAATELLPMGFLVNKFGKAGVSKFVAGMLAREIPSEQVATLVQDAVDTAVANPDKTWGDYWNERLGAQYQTAVATLVQGAAYGAASEAAYRMSGAKGKIEKSADDFVLFGKLADLVQASKLRERSPRKFNEFIKQVEAKAPDSYVYIEAEGLAQSGIKPEQLAEIAPSVAEQMDSLTEGGMVKVPVSEFLSQVVSDESLSEKILPHIKTDPEGFSQAEAKLYSESEADILKAEVEKVLTEKSGDDQFKASRDVVYKTTLGKLKSVNRFTDDVNKPYATLLSNFYSVMAARTGKTPEQMAAQYPLNIVAEDVAAPSLMQQVKTGIQSVVDKVLPKRQEAPKIDFVENFADLTNITNREAAIQYIQKQTRQTPSGIPLSNVPNITEKNFYKFEPQLREFVARAFPEMGGFTYTDKEGNKQTISTKSLAQSAAKRKNKNAEIKVPVAEELKTDTSQFKKWFGDSKVINSDGSPKIVYHGTTRDIKAFDKATANPESDLGAGFYFSDSQEDVSNNYAGYGPDITNKIERRAEQIADDQVIPFEEAEVLAKKEFASNDGFALPVYLSLKNPVVIGGAGETLLTYDQKFNEKTEEYEGEPEGTLADFVDALNLISQNYTDFDSTEVISSILEEASYEGIKAGDLISLIKNHEGAAYIEHPETGQFVSSDIIRQAFEAAGFDGIIDYTVGAKFPRMAGIEEATHYVAFKPEQIKSVFNEGQFDPENPNILKQNGEQRGAFIPSSTTIALLKNADLSTFLHESGHFFLDTLSKVADKSPQLQDDMNTVLKWFGVPDLATWNSMSLEQQRESHEKFARGFEAYLFEGKSPSLEMKDIFQRFRAWLMNIYRQLSNLNVDLNDEVRQVFDRMLATNEQIAQMEYARNAAPLFGIANQGGMTPEEFALYTVLGTQASQDAISSLEIRSIRDMKWLSNARGRKVRELQRQAKAKRDAVKRQVTDEVMHEPVYAAEAFIRSGQLNDEAFKDMPQEQRERITAANIGKTKLDISALQDMYGDNGIWTELDTGRYGLMSQNGIHPDTLAELFGFSSGDHLVQELLKAEPVREKIDGMTDQRMLERYGELVDEKSISQAADEAIHNEARTRFVATEMQALQRAAGQKRVMVQLAKQYANGIVSAQRVKDLRPLQYSMAEAKQARLAEEALKANDIEAAATHKRNQLVQNIAAKGAFEAKAEIDKALKYFNKFDKAAAVKTIDPDNVQQIQALLGRFNLSKSIPAWKLQEQKSLRDWADKQAEAGLEPDVPAELLNEAFRKSYKDMTVEEFRGLVDTVRQMEHLGRLKSKLLTAAKNAEFDVAKADIVASIEENAKGPYKDLRTRTKNIGQKLLNGTKRFLSLHRKMASMSRQMDGGKDAGAMWSYFIRPMNEAGEQEAEMRAAAAKKLAKIVKPLLKTGKMGGRGQFFEELGISLNREERIAIALNLGNQSNMQRLLDGEGWTIEQIQPVLETLTKDEWDFVQNVWDFFEDYRPQIAAKEKRVYGREPTWIEPAILHTKFGDYRGGYYPVKYDPARSGRAEAHAEAEDAKNMLKGAYTAATTRRSFVKNRAEKVVGRPLIYSLAGLYNGANEVIHDLSWHEWLIDVNRLLRNKAIDGSIRLNYGAETVTLFKDAIKDIARGDQPAINVWEQGINHLRHGATIAGLGWNFTTSLLQPLGLTNSMVRIGPGWVARGITKWLGSPVDVTNEIYEKSSMMRLRGQTMQREINEIQNQLSGDKGKIREVVEASMFLTIQKMQLVADIPTWLGQYEKAIAAHGDEAQAVAEANQAVLDSQGGGQIKDLSGIQRGGPLQKLFTNFYSYFNVVFNLASEVGARTNFSNPAQVAAAARDYILLFIVPVVLADMIRQSLFGSGDDDEDQMVSRLINEEISYMMGTMIGVREATATIQKLMGVNQFDLSYQGPAGLRLFSELDKLGTQIEQGEWDKALRKASINTAGILFHLPSGQINKTWDGVEALMNGETENPAAIIGGPPRN